MQHIPRPCTHRSTQSGAHHPALQACRSPGCTPAHPGWTRRTPHGTARADTPDLHAIILIFGPYPLSHRSHTKCSLDRPSKMHLTHQFTVHWRICSTLPQLDSRQAQAHTSSSPVGCNQPLQGAKGLHPMSAKPLGPLLVGLRKKPTTPLRTRVDILCQQKGREHSVTAPRPCCSPSLHPCIYVVTSPTTWKPGQMYCQCQADISGMYGCTGGLHSGACMFMLIMWKHNSSLGCS